MKINKKILASGISLSLLFCLGTSSFAATGTVNTETVNVRAGASTDATIITNLELNDSVEVLGEDGEWYQIKSENSTGYIFKEFLDVSGEIEKPEEKTEETQPVEKTEEVSKEETKVEEKKSEKEYAIGNKTNSNSSIYLLPALGSSKILSVDVNTEVEIVKTMNKWSNVKVNGKLGWIPNQKLYVIDNVVEETQEEQPEETENDENNNIEMNEKAYVNTESANLREGPSTSYYSIAGLAQYEYVTVLAEQDGWYKVRTTDNMEGYVSKSLVTLGNPPVTARSAADRRNNVVQEEEPVADEGGYSYVAPSGNAGGVVATAQQYLGYSYVYGGSSPYTGFDCSGFTSYVYSTCGMDISRTSYSQANDGVGVDRSDLQPGDLLLFNNGGGGSIGHVGIYVGDGSFIHASNPTGGVKYDTIDSGYYATYYAGARRLY